MEQRQKQLIEELILLDSQGMNYGRARKILLEKGYTQNELAHALYSFNYDGIPNPPEQVSKLEKQLKSDPKLAEKYAELIMKHDVNLEQQNLKTAATALASQYAPGRHAQSYYAGRTAHYLDFPLITMYVAMIIVLIPAIAYDLPLLVHVVPWLFIVPWVIKHIIDTDLQVWLRKEAKQLAIYLLIWLVIAIFRYLIMNT